MKYLLLLFLRALKCRKLIMLQSGPETELICACLWWLFSVRELFIPYKPRMRLFSYLSVCLSAWSLFSLPMFLLASKTQIWIYMFFFFFSAEMKFVQLSEVTNGLCNLFSPYESGRVMRRYFLQLRETHKKKNVGNIISRAELTLLQFYVSWEIIVSWAAANDYWELIVCDV